MCIRVRVAAGAVYVKHIRTVGSNMCQMLDGSENVFRVMLMAKYRFARNYIFACLSMISKPRLASRPIFIHLVKSQLDFLLFFFARKRISE